MELGGIGARRCAQGVGAYLLVLLGAWAIGCDSEPTQASSASSGTDAGEAGAGGVGQGGLGGSSAGEAGAGGVGQGGLGGGSAGEAGAGGVGHGGGGAGGASESSSASSGVGGAGGGGGCSDACSISADCPAPGDVCTSMGLSECRVCLHACAGSMCPGLNTCVSDADCNASPDARCVCAENGCTICVIGLF
jgi:hypothetical protein